MSDGLSSDHSRLWVPSSTSNLEAFTRKTHQGLFLMSILRLSTVCPFPFWPQRITEYGSLSLEQSTKFGLLSLQNIWSPFSDWSKVLNLGLSYCKTFGPEKKQKTKTKTKTKQKNKKQWIWTFSLTAKKKHLEDFWPEKAMNLGLLSNCRTFWGFSDPGKAMNLGARIIIFRCVELSNANVIHRRVAWADLWKWDA